jgi:prepilin-type N-terminal cleavage/methylation domain-containing protein
MDVDCAPCRKAGRSGRECGDGRRAAPVRAFTITEILVAIAIISVLISMLFPALGRARQAARMSVCLSNVRQLGVAWTMYANDWKDRAMPLASWRDTGEQIFWWGSHGTSLTPPSYSAGLLTPYLDSALTLKSVFDCPSQAWGTYRPQGPSRAPTSTYGYNGYFLAPETTPGWADSIGHRPWQRVGDLVQPTRLLVFADTMLPPNSQNGTPSNNALLDPPMLWAGGQADNWVRNPFPTTSFRHYKTRENRSSGLASGVRGDGSASSHEPEPAAIVNFSLGIGSMSRDNDPWYVPDWREWR